MSWSTKGVLEVWKFQKGRAALQRVRSNMESLFGMIPTDGEDLLTFSTNEEVRSIMQATSTIPEDTRRSSPDPNTMQEMSDPPLPHTSCPSKPEQTCTNLRDTMVLLLSSAKPHILHGTLVATVNKAFSIIEKGEVLPSFEQGVSLVKSTTSHHPHIVSFKKTSGVSNVTKNASITNTSVSVLILLLYQPRRRLQMNLQRT